MAIACNLHLERSVAICKASVGVRQQSLVTWRGYQHQGVRDQDQTKTRQAETRAFRFVEKKIRFDSIRFDNLIKRTLVLYRSNDFLSIAEFLFSNQ